MRRTLLAILIAFSLSLVTTSPAHAAFPGYPVTPDPADFGDVKVGQASATQTLTMTNLYAVPVTVQQVAVVDTTNFTILNNLCNSRILSPNETCTVDVVFIPQSAGHIVSSTALQTYGALEPGLSTIEGNAVEPVVVTYPTSIDFGDQTVGKSSNERVAAVLNDGSVPLSISSITADPPFTITSNNCPASLPAYYACGFHVVFSPTAEGAVSGNFTIVDDASDSPQTIPLTGTGVTAPQPIASLSSVELNFSGQLIGTTSATQDVTLKNTGAALLNITGIAISGDFAVTDDCGATLAIDDLCTLSMTFTPLAAGAETGTVTITDDASGSPQTIALTGTGVTHDGPSASLSTNAIDFGQVTDGTSSTAQSYTIENVGDEDMVIDDIEMVGDDAASFTKESDCLRTIIPGDSCSGRVTFHPNDQRTFTATIEFHDNTADSPQTILLTGTGVYATVDGGGCSMASSANATLLAPMLLLLAGASLASRRRR